MSIQPVWEVAISSGLLLGLFPALVVSPLISKHWLQIGYMDTQHTFRDGIQMQILLLCICACVKCTGYVLYVCNMCVYIYICKK